MNQRTLKTLAVAFGIMVIIVVVALVVNRRTDAPEVETIPERAVGAHIVVEEETTSEEETTTAAVTASVFAGVDPVQETTEETTEVPSYSAEEIARYVLDNGINGDERKAYLGERYEEVQKWIDENYVPPVKSVSTPSQQDVNTGYDYPTGDVLTPSAGVCYFNGHMETYYNLPMGGVIDIMYSLGYSGDYWVRSDGCKMFGDYIMVAADFGWLPRGSVVLTSLGWGMVCDTGAGGSNWLDIATCW